MDGSCDMYPVCVRACVCVCVCPRKDLMKGEILSTAGLRGRVGARGRGVKGTLDGTGRALAAPAQEWIGKRRA